MECGAEGGRKTSFRFGGVLGAVGEGGCTSAPATLMILLLFIGSTVTWNTVVLN